MRLLQLCFCTLTIKVRCSTQSLDRECLLSLKFGFYIFVQNSEVCYHSLSLMQQKIKPVAQRLVEYMTFLKIRKQETSWRNISKYSVTSFHIFMRTSYKYVDWRNWLNVFTCAEKRMSADQLSTSVKFDSE